MSIQGYGQGLLPVVASKEEFKALTQPLVSYAKTPIDSSVCRLWLVRHGQSQGNADKVNMGSDESALTEQGKEQARVFAKMLVDLVDDFSEVVCSSISRTEETANEINAVWEERKSRPLAKPFTKMAGLNERFCGQHLQGRTVTESIYAPYKKREEDDIAQLERFEEKFEYQMRHADGQRVHDQESLAMTYTRGIPAILEIAKRNCGKNVLVNTHIGLMRAMIIGLASIGHTEHKQPVSLEVRSFDLPNGACMILESDGKSVVLKAASDLTFKR